MARPAWAEDDEPCSDPEVDRWLRRHRSERALLDGGLEPTGIGRAAPVSEGGRSGGSRVGRYTRLALKAAGGGCSGGCGNRGRRLAPVEVTWRD